MFTETFNISPTNCEGLDLDGVLYSFTVDGSPSLECLVDGGPSTNNIQPPNIQGPAPSVLHLNFDVPTTEFGFGVAQNTNVSPQSVIVDLFRPGAGLLREEVPLITTNDPFFVGGRYDYHGPAVKTVTISFRNGAPSPGIPGRFVIDNVSYFRPPGQSKK